VTVVHPLYQYYTRHFIFNAHVSGLGFTSVCLLVIGCHYADEFLSTYGSRL